MKSTTLRWGPILLAGFMAELLVFAVVFPTLYLFGQQAFLASILIASTVMPFIGAVWVGRRVESRFVLHGGLVGVVAALIYIGLSWGQTQPLLYHISHGFKIIGGIAGGIVAYRRKAAPRAAASASAVVG
jgi:putative membrane protein (TIGR04086 family)